MDLGLSGKKAIVTGGTKGIGRGIVERLLNEGCDVGLCARTEEDVEATVRDLEGVGGKVTGAAVNVRDGDAYKAWLEGTAEELGGCDIFVPNVSAGAGMDSEKNWWKSFEIDLLGTVRGCETLMPKLEASDAGSVVAISSTNALSFFAAPMAYNAVKCAIINYTSQLAEFVAKNNVRVNAVSPGPIYFEGGAWEMIKGAQPDFYKATMRSLPLGRMGTPEEVANVVAFIASPAGSLITGANIVADAGFTKHVQI